MFYFIVLGMLVSCNKENDTLSENVDNNLTEKQVIDELNLLVHHFKNESQKVTPSNQIDLYKQHLDLINKKLNLNLKYDENDVKLIQYFSEKEESKSMKVAALYSNQEQNTIIEQLKESPNYVLYLDAMQIIESIEPMRISWGCRLSLAGNFVATLSLGGCVTGFGYPLAIAGKAIAMASIAASC